MDKNTMMRSIKNIANTELSEQGLIGVVSSMSPDGKTANVQTFVDGEARENKTIGPYGISYSPPKGVQAQVMKNDNDNTTMIGVYDKNKPAVKPGEIMLYAIGGQRIYLKADGSILITGGGTTINIHGGSVDITGELKVNGRTI